MDRFAIFVDAGYLFAQGSVAIGGAGVIPRAKLALNETAAVAELCALAASKCPQAQLLRIYWYDGAPRQGPSAEHARIAETDDVKVRLGFLNSGGEQKGVDSLIVTDMVELARNRSISDAVLLSGDEDVRIGVQIAQNFGVRVHLLGIVPSRGSQSAELRREADTVAEWDAKVVHTFLSQRAPVSVPVAAGSSVSAIITAIPGAGAPASGFDPMLKQAADSFVANLTSQDIAGIKAFQAGNRGVPPEFDGKLLIAAAHLLGRNLSKAEVRTLRTMFTAGVTAVP